MTCYCMPSIFAPFHWKKNIPDSLFHVFSQTVIFHVTFVTLTCTHTHDSSFYGTSDWIVWETYSHCCFNSVWAQWQIFDFIPSKCFSLYASCTLILPFLIVTLHHSLTLINDTRYWSNFSSLSFFLYDATFIEKYCFQLFELTIAYKIMSCENGQEASEGWN